LNEKKNDYDFEKNDDLKENSDLIALEVVLGSVPICGITPTYGPLV
jgi:hypothetical protein